MSDQRIIREEDGARTPNMFALMLTWGLDAARCGVAECDGLPTTIVRQGTVMFCLCELHHQKCVTKNGIDLTLDRYVESDPC